MNDTSSRAIDPAAALALFSALPLKERLFVRARLRSAPLAELARRTPGGRIADIGCGHGLLTALLACGGGCRSVLGVDPDPRKIRWASQALSPLTNASVRCATVEQLCPELESSFDGLVIADVLYLLPVASWPPFLRAARQLLRPGGVLLLKEAEADGSWKYWKCLAQEAAMVRLLRRTQHSGGLQFRPRQLIGELLGQSGFGLDEVVGLAKGYSTPHVLFAATAR